MRPALGGEAAKGQLVAYARQSDTIVVDVAEGEKGVSSRQNPFLDPFHPLLPSRFEPWRLPTGFCFLVS